MSSTLRVNSISDSAGANGNAITLATDGTCTAKVTNRSNRNKVQNGACTISQRGTTTGLTSSNYGGPDRWKFVCWSLGTWTVSQDTESPDGFAYSYKMDCTTAQASPPASSGLGLERRFEGQDFQDLAYGTASAKSVTISFWIRCNKTGNFQVNWKNNGRSRIISSVQTINSANTWEKKTMTFAGDTVSSQTIDNATGNNCQIEMRFDGGSDEKGGTAPTSWEAVATTDRAAGVTLALGDSTSNEIFVTGLQLEIGDTATDFEHRSFGDDLLKCLRYYWKAGHDFGGDYPMGLGNTFYSGTRHSIGFITPVPMRASPSISDTGDSCRVYGQGTYKDVTSYTDIGISGPYVRFVAHSSDLGDDNHACHLSNRTNSGIVMSAEL